MTYLLMDKSVIIHHDSLMHCTEPEIQFHLSEQCSSKPVQHLRFTPHKLSLNNPFQQYTFYWWEVVNQATNPTNPKEGLPDIHQNLWFKPSEKSLPLISYERSV